MREEIMLLELLENMGSPEAVKTKDLKREFVRQHGNKQSGFYSMLFYLDSLEIIQKEKREIKVNYKKLQEALK